MLRENEDLDGALREFCRLLAKEEFFEAHEVLEEAWHVLRRRQDPLASPIKGLINAAIAFEHLRRNRPKSRQVAEKAMASYLRRIRAEKRLEEACEMIEALRKERGI
jgi:predicted metal-dependent hydrolase